MITDFLKTERNPDDLKVALNALREFKECHTDKEWLGIDFAAWAKLDQLEEFLSHLVDGVDLADDTKEYIARHDNN